MPDGPSHQRAREIIEERINEIEDELGSEFKEVRDLEKRVKKLTDDLELLRKENKKDYPDPQLVKNKVKETKKLCGQVSDESRDLAKKLDETKKHIAAIDSEVVQNMN